MESKFLASNSGEGKYLLTAIIYQQVRLGVELAILGGGGGGRISELNV